MFPQPPLEVPNIRLICARVAASRQIFEPNRIFTQSLEPEHPLQRHGKVASTFSILCRKPAPDEDGHTANMAAESLSFKVLSLRPAGQDDRTATIVRNRIE